MLYDNGMGNTGNRSSFVIARPGQESSCGNKQDTFPFSGQYPGQKMCRKYHGRASASASAGVGILRLGIIDQKAAVLMDGCQIYSMTGQEIQEDLLPDHAQIPGNDGVVI